MRVEVALDWLVVHGVQVILDSSHNLVLEFLTLVIQGNSQWVSKGREEEIQSLVPDWVESVSDNTGLADFPSGQFESQIWVYGVVENLVGALDILSILDCDLDDTN